MLLKDIDIFIENLKMGVRSYPNNKLSLIGRIEAFIKHLNIKYKSDISTEFLDNYKYKSKEERLLNILKHLHSGKKSRSDISEAFGISDRTLSDDLNTLLDGFDFMGFKMQISEIERGSNIYKSLIHPIFLAMNTSEIFSLIIGLKMLSKGTIFEYELDKISNQVYQQLSEHTKEIINQHFRLRGINYTEEKMEFINSLEYMKTKSTKVPYFLKGPIPCKVRYTSHGHTKDIEGILCFSEDEENILRKIAVKSGNEITEIWVDDIVDIFKVEG